MWFDRAVPWRHYRDSKPRLPKKVFLEQFAWSASPVYACEHVKPLPWSRHALGPPSGIAELRRTATGVGFGLRAVFALQPYLYSRVPPVPALTLAPPRLQCTHPRAPECSRCFRDASLYWHGHTPAMSALGCTRGLGALSPCAKRTPRSCSCLESAGPHGAAALPLVAVLALPIPLYLQVPRRATGDIPPITYQQEKSSCQSRALIRILFLQYRCYTSNLCSACPPYVTLCFDIHNYYAMHLFPKSVGSS